MQGMNDKWTLDKRIPVIPAILLVAQLFVFIWWAAKLESRVSRLEEKEQVSSPMLEKVSKMEIRLEYMGQTQNENTKKLDRVLDGYHPNRP